MYCMWNETERITALQLSFDTREEAVAFAERNGWKYELIADTSKDMMDLPPGTNKYQHNFLSRKVRVGWVRLGWRKNSCT